MGIQSILYDDNYRLRHIDKQPDNREITFVKVNTTKKQRKGGRVKVSSLFDEILMSIEEFKSLPEDEAKRYLSEWRSRHSVRKIAEGLGCTDSTMYYYLNKYDLIDKNRSESASRSRKLGHDKRRKQQTQQAVELPPAELTVSAATPVPENNVVVLPTRDGMQFSFTGEHEAKKIISKFEKLSLILEDEESRFDIKLFIQEVPKEA